MVGNELSGDRNDFPNVTDFSIFTSRSKKLLAFELII